MPGHTNIKYDRMSARQWRRESKNVETRFVAKTKLLKTATHCTTQPTGWGKITSINFKVNNKQTILRYKYFIFGFWNYNMGSFKSHSLKKNILQVVAVVCVQSVWETAKRTVWQPRCSLVFERSVVVLIFFQTHSPFPWSSQPTTECIFGPVLGPEGGFGSEYGTHAAPLR